MILLDDLTITITESGRPRLAVTGDVDATNAFRLRLAIVAAAVESFGEVEVDLSGVTFIDSTGLRALVDASTALGLVELVLCEVPRHVSRILEITGIARSIEVRCA